jgi:hypothetical protein
MGFTLRIPEEGLATCLARVGANVAVSAYVIIHIATRYESFLANITLIWLILGVVPHMLNNVGFLLKDLAAYCAVIIGVTRVGATELNV